MTRRADAVVPRLTLTLAIQRSATDGWTAPNFHRNWDILVSCPSARCKIAKLGP